MCRRCRNNCRSRPAQISLNQSNPWIISILSNDFCHLDWSLSQFSSHKGTFRGFTSLVVLFAPDVNLNRRSFSSFRSGDLVILTFLSTGTSDNRRSERYQPFNCISWMVLFTKSASKWPKLPTGTRLFLWNRDRKRCLHIPHIHLPLVNVTISSLAFSQLPLHRLHWLCC